MAEDRRPKTGEEEVRAALHACALAGAQKEQHSTHLQEYEPVLFFTPVSETRGKAHGSTGSCALRDDGDGDDT